MSLNLDSIKSSYGLSFIQIGMRCNMNGKNGVVTGSSGAYVFIRYDGEQHSVPCHPTWGMTYYSAEGKVIIDFKGAQAIDIKDEDGNILRSYIQPVDRETGV